MTGLFDKFKRGIGESINKVSVKSKEMLDASTVKNQISDLKRNRLNSVIDLGNTTFTKFQENLIKDEDLKKICEVVLAVGKSILVKEEELRQIHIKAEELMGQPKPLGICDCGTEIHEGTIFCGKCGKKVEENTRKIN